MAIIPQNQINSRRLLAQALMNQGTSAQALDKAGRSPLHGLANMIRQYGAGRANYLADQQEQENLNTQNQALAQAMRGNTINYNALLNSGDPGLGQMALNNRMQMSLARERARLGASSGRPAASIQEFNFRQGLSGDDQRVFDRLTTSQKVLNLGDRQVVLDPFSPTGIGAQYKTGLRPSDVPENAAAKTSAVERARQTEKKQAELDKQQNKRIGQLEETDDTLQSSLKLIDKAKTQVKEGYFTTGSASFLTSRVPGTTSFDLSKTIDTLRSRAGLGKLMEIRLNSPTGGALGQQSDREGKLLEDSVTNLSQSQSQEQFLENLEMYRQSLISSRERLMKAYERDFGKAPPDDFFNSPLKYLNKTGGGLSADEQRELEQLEKELGIK